MVLTPLAGTTLLSVALTVPSTRPASLNIVSAAVSVKPVTSGTTTCAGGPLEICRLTVDPGSTSIPALGVVPTMLPAATVGLFAVVDAPTAKPAVVKAVSAAARVKPVTSGTTTCAGGPLEICRFTVDPGLISIPTLGVVPIMLPAATVGLFAVVDAPTAKPAAVKAVSAAARVKPVTSGTGTRLGTLPSPFVSDHRR